MAPEKIAATSYLNTIPFIYGIENAYNKRSELLLSSPRLCAEAYIAKNADIALVPVGVIPSLNDAKIITPYCLGASSAVRSVVLVGDKPLSEIKSICLDTDSLTSVKLLKIICRELWKISPEFTSDKLSDASLLIGDKVFENEGRYKYSYDLSLAWFELTGLPFVFALWVAREGVEQKSVAQLSDALKYGLENIDKSISYYNHQDKSYAYEYLTQNIDYIFDNDKRTALRLFWEKSKEVDPPSLPG